MPSNGFKCPDSSEQDPILKIPDKYKDHSSIKLFGQIGMEEPKKSFQSLDPKKVAQKDNVKTNLLKKNAYFFCKVHM